MVEAFVAAATVFVFLIARLLPPRLPEVEEGMAEGSSTVLP